MEKGLTRFNQKLHKISQNIRKHDKKLRTKDDGCIGSSSPTRRVHGIDDPLLDGSISDSGSKRRRRHRWKSGYTSAESGGEISDHGHGRHEIHGHRWITRDWGHPFTSKALLYLATDIIMCLRQAYALKIGIFLGLVWKSGSLHCSGKKLIRTLGYILLMMKQEILVFDNTCPSNLLSSCFVNSQII